MSLPTPLGLAALATAAAFGLQSQSPSRPAAPASTPNTAAGLAWVDVDVDGFDDLLAADAAGGLKLLRNAGNGQMVDVTESYGLAGLSGVVGALWTDADASCSAPNVAGLIACLWSSTPAYSADSIAFFANGQALYLLDWGSSGHDITYGRGGANLVPFAPNTRWMTSIYSNSSGASWRPTNTLAHAESQTPSGGRVVVLQGGPYPQAPVTLTQPMTFECYGANAVFGN